MKRPGTPTYPKTVGPWELEPYYSRHVGAMTSEGLHAKADIAHQLALRDQRIAELEDLVRTLRPAPFLEGGAMTLELERDNSPAPAVQYHCLNGCGADVSEPMVCLACYEASVREGR